MGTPHPNRMALMTTIAFMFFALAVGLLDTKLGTRHPSPWLTLVVILMGLTGVVGYVSGISSFYALGEWSTMALPTALAFVLLGCGLLLSRPERSPTRLLVTSTSGGALARRLLPVVVIPMALGLLRAPSTRRSSAGPPPRCHSAAQPPPTRPRLASPTAIRPWIRRRWCACAASC